MAPNLDFVQHSIEPVFDTSSVVLVLGTMPSPASRKIGFYYGHKQNRFWRVLAKLWQEPVPQSIAEKKRFALDHKVALWDVLASCDIAGASDASIVNPKPNDLSRIFSNAPIQSVCTTGSRATQLFQKFQAPLFPNITHIALPSTSSANARMSFEALVEAYQPLRKAVENLSVL